MSRGGRFAVEYRRAKTIFTNEAPLKLSRYALLRGWKSGDSLPDQYIPFVCRSIAGYSKTARRIFWLMIALMLRPLDVVGIMYHFTESSLRHTIASETDIACISLHFPFSRFLFRELLICLGL